MQLHRETKKGSKKKKGRPELRFKDTDRRQVKTMVGYGIPLKDIAGVFKIDTRTLKRHFKSEIETGKTHANSQVAQALFKNAVGTPLEVKDAEGKVIERHERAGNTVAQIFWLKAQAGWSDQPKDPSKPLMQENAKVSFYIPANGREKPEKLTDEQRREIEAMKKLHEEQKAE